MYRYSWWFSRHKTKTRGLELLKQNSTVINSYHDSLSIDINEFYTFFHTEIDVSTKEVTMDWKDNRAYFKKNMTWFEDYSNREINEEFIKYALSSIDYRNRVISFHELYYIIYLSHLREYKEEAKVLISKLNSQVK